MHLMILSLVVAVTHGAPSQSFLTYLPPPDLPQFLRSNPPPLISPLDYSSQFDEKPSSARNVFPNYPKKENNNSFCKEGQKLNVLGECVETEVYRNLYVFEEPPNHRGLTEPLKPIPRPQVKLNLIVVRTAEDEEVDPIIVPPAREKTLVLVLSKKEDDTQQVIEVPAPPGERPEVYFIEYAEGDNSLLPGGIFLQDALNYASEANSEKFTRPYSPIGSFSHNHEVSNDAEFSAGAYNVGLDSARGALEGYNAESKYTNDNSGRFTSSSANAGDLNETSGWIGITRHNGRLEESSGDKKRIKTLQNSNLRDYSEYERRFESLGVPMRQSTRSFPRNENREFVVGTTIQI